MRYRLALLIALAFVAAVGTSPAVADPTQDTEATRSIEGAFGLPAGNVDLSVYAQAYDIVEDGVARTVAAVTIFVDGASALECFSLREGAVVTVEPDLGGGRYRAAYEGTCFDFATEESLPFTASLDVQAIGTGLVRTRAGSYATEDGKRCVSQIRSRSASASGTVAVTIPDRGIDASGTVSDEFSELRSFEQRCYRTAASPGSRPAT